MSEAKTRPNLGTDSIPRLIWMFSLPAIVGLMINASYNFVDRIFVGNGVGAIGLAGLVVSFPSAVIQMAFGMMIGVGGSVNFAVSLGQGRVYRAERILTNSLVLVTVITLVLVVFQFIFLEEILTLFGATETIMPYAKQYLGITLMGSIFFMANMTMNNFIRASGFPKIAMFTMLIGAITNTILDPIFIFVLDKGIAGAAMATVFAQMVAFLWAAWFFVSKKAPYRVRSKFLAISPKIAKMICFIGLAPFLIQLCNSFVQTILNKALVGYGGDLAISAMGVAMSTAMLMFMIVIGLCEGAQPVIGFNLGAKNYKRITKIYRLTTLLSTVVFVISWILIQLFADHIVAVFDPNDEELIRVGSQALKTITLLLPFIGLSTSTSFFLQAVKSPRLSAFLAVSRQLIFLVPSVIILPKYIGLAGVFYALPLSDFLAFLLAIPMMSYQLRKFKRLAHDRQVSEMIISGPPLIPQPSFS